MIVDIPRTKGSVHENSVVEFGGRSRNVDGLHLLEATQRMALWDELGDGPLVQGARDEQYNIVDHVAVSDEIQKLRQRLGRVIAHVLKLDDQLFPELVVDHAHRQG